MVENTDKVACCKEGRDGRGEFDGEMCGERGGDGEMFDWRISTYLATSDTI